MTNLLLASVSDTCSTAIEELNMRHSQFLEVLNLFVEARFYNLEIFNSFIRAFGNHFDEFNSKDSIQFVSLLVRSGLN